MDKLERISKAHDMLTRDRDALKALKSEARDLRERVKKSEDRLERAISGDDADLFAPGT